RFGPPVGQISMITLLAAGAGRRKVGVPWRAGLMVLTGGMVVEPVDAGAAAGGGVAAAPLSDADGAGGGGNGASGGGGSADGGGGGHGCVRRRVSGALSIRRVAPTRAATSNSASPAKPGLTGVNVSGSARAR